MGRKASKDCRDQHPILVFDYSSAAGVLSGTDTDANGQPVKRFTKEIMRCGEWFMPSTQVGFEVTPNTIDNWVTQFSAMKAAGVEVPVTTTHDYGSKDVVGKVVDMWREGDSLKCAMDLVGEEAIKLASVLDVSVGSNEEIVDGKKNTYTWAIDHVAMTPKPVVTGMSKFRPVTKVAASINGKRKVFDAPVLRLATGGSMDALAKVAKELGIDVEGMGDEEVLKAVLGRCQEMSAAINEKKDGDADKDKALAAARTEIKTLKASLDSGKAPKVSPDVIEMGVESAETRIAALVSSKCIDKKAADAIRAVLCGTEDDRPAFCFSREAAAHVGLSAPLAKTILSALELIDVAALHKAVTGERSGPQRITASREVPGNGLPPSDVKAPENRDPDIDADAKKLYGARANFGNALPRMVPVKNEA